VKKRINPKKMVLRRETLANLVGGLMPAEGTTINDTVYSKRPDCVPLSTHCQSADTNCTACIA
jgi:hypothetical protein